MLTILFQMFQLAIQVSKDGLPGRVPLWVILLSAFAGLLLLMLLILVLWKVRTKVPLTFLSQLSTAFWWNNLWFIHAVEYSITQQWKTLQWWLRQNQKEKCISQTLCSIWSHFYSRKKQTCSKIMEYLSKGWDYRELSFVYYIGNFNQSSLTFISRDEWKFSFIEKRINYCINLRIPKQ